ncbi:MAG TPA: cytochrome c3 family protein, partial [Bryobacteraceae bacterium]|nr:cytochrome c3 family protein [Bryobacteraceae bacterium]
CRTGERRWHFQTVHHNLWDYDLPAQPLLARIGERDAVVQVAKTGFVFVLDRDTGKPIFPVEERPVPASAVPGEASSPTQPYPLAPPPFARQSMRRDELTSVTPDSRRECLEMIRNAEVDTSLFDPIGEKVRVMFPGTNGGANWGGASYDAAAATLYVNSMDVGSFFKLVPRPAGSSLPYRIQGFSRFWDSNGYPCQQPPWGSLTAIDLARGTIRWRAVLGEFPELKKRGIRKTGTPNLGGSIVTAGGLVFIAATNDSRFRAFDKDTGEELWSVELPASGHATPVTYRGPKTGRQYIAIAAGGGNKYNRTYAAKLVVFALPAGRAAVERRIAPAARSYTGTAEKLPAAVAPQPVPFSHRRHTPALACEVCHRTAATAERAGLPDGSVCAKCHLRQNAISALRAGDWVRVYKVPGFVFFSHARHTGAGIQCERCHGAAGARDVVVKEVSTGMAACLDCHRASGAPVACDTCHQLGQ